MATATLVVGAAILFAAVARAGHSPLDGTFDGDGAVLTPLDAIWATAIQPDGRILAAGSAGGDFAVARYEADGTPDDTFDGDGLATSAASPAFEGVAFDVAVQADGKIVVAGATGFPINFNFGLVRFEANGALDGTFGSGSVAVVDVGANDFATCVAIQPDGKIVVVGQSDDGGGGDLVLFRLDTAGAPDPTFDGDGVVTIDLGVITHAGCLALQADGKILVAATSDTNAAVLRYDVNGMLDPTFDGDGIALVDLPPPLFGERVAVQTDGRIVLLGTTAASPLDFDDIVLARFDTGGTLDATFDGGGISLTRLRGNHTRAADLLLQPDDRIIVVGNAPDVTVLRYDVDGSRDPSFDGDGVLYTNLMVEGGAPTTSSVARSGALDASGRIVVGAVAFGGSVPDENYALRYDVPPVCDSTPRLDCESAWLGADVRSLENAPGRERLLARLTSGPPLPQSAFGNPVVPSGTQYRLCLYDGSDRLVASVDVDRAGEFCQGTACWKAVGATGYAYLDHERRADGAQRVFLRGGPTRSLVTLLGRNRPPQNQWDLPTGIPQRLLGSPSVTMQFVPSDTGGCFSKQLTQILVSSPTKFRAE
jgi:uncharacterized delta-60 repeat protein